MKNIKRVGIFLSMLILIFAMIGCSTNKTDDTKTSNKENVNIQDKLSITGFSDGDIEISIEDIKKYTPVEKSASGKNSSGKEVKLNAKGTLLEDILKDNGKSQKEIRALRLVAGDGYSIEVPNEILKNRDVILAYEADGKDLHDDTKPIRVIIPNERAMYWVKNLVKIEVLNSVEQVKINKVMFIETAVFELNKYDFEYKGAKDEAVKGKELIEKYCKNNSSDIVYIKAADGLEKNEQIKNFVIGDLKITGKDSPAFLSEDLPKGMHVKDILWLSHGQTAFISHNKASEILESKTIRDKKGVALKSIFQEIGLEEGKSYKLSAEDGYNVELSSEEVENTIVYINNKGQLKSHLDGDKSKSVKGLLSVEVIK
jgi:DMSO/TMAO reductase YedYZ molybdopterin-dependent catalytic subunit